MSNYFSRRSEEKHLRNLGLMDAAKRIVLSSEERESLKKCQFPIDCWLAFRWQYTRYANGWRLRIGESLRKIQEHRLFREEYDSFYEYVISATDISYTHALRLIFFDKYIHGKPGKPLPKALWKAAGL